MAIARDRPVQAVATVLAVLASIMVVIAPLDSSVASAARTWVVAPDGDNASSGTELDPLATIRAAVARARSGDSIVLRGGTYREEVQVYRKTLHISSYPGERAILDGAVTVESWNATARQWYSEGWTHQHYREPSGGSVARSDITAGYPDQLFIDGQPLRQVLRRADVAPGTFFHDTYADRLWIGDDPSGRTVEASKHRFGFYFNGAHGSSLTGVTVRRYATEARHMAAIRAYADDVTLDDVIAEHNARIGLSAIGTNVVIRDSRFVDNGHLGIHADRSDTLVIERSAVQGNNKAGFDAKHSAGGIKVTSSTGVTVRDSDVSRNAGPGIWTDLDTNDVTIVGNLVERNGRAGVEIELSSRVNVLNNVALDNGEAGIWVLESQHIQVLHNASYDNKNAIEVEEGPRREVRNVRIHNNVLARGKADSRALLDISDWTAERSAWQMRVSVDANAYWIPAGSGTDNLSRWGRGPQRPAFSDDLSEHRRSTGQAIRSQVSTSEANPFARSESTLDFRAPGSIGTGSSVAGSAAQDLGVSAGSSPRIGPLTEVERR